MSSIKRIGRDVSRLLSWYRGFLLSVSCFGCVRKSGSTPAESFVVAVEEPSLRTLSIVLVRYLG